MKVSAVHISASLNSRGSPPAPGCIPSLSLCCRHSFLPIAPEMRRWRVSAGGLCCLCTNACSCIPLMRASFQLQSQRHSVLGFQLETQHTVCVCPQKRVGRGRFKPRAWGCRPPANHPTQPHSSIPRCLVWQFRGTSVNQFIHCKKKPFGIYHSGSAFGCSGRDWQPGRQPGFMVAGPMEAALIWAMLPVAFKPRQTTCSILCTMDIV